MYVFTEEYRQDEFQKSDAWVPVGPFENPHTYPTLENMADYQADYILEYGCKVYVLVEVPAITVQLIMKQYAEEA